MAPENNRSSSEEFDLIVAKADPVMVWEHHTEPLADQNQLERAASARKIANKAIKDIDAQRKKITRHLDKAKKEVMGQAKAAMAPLEKVREVVDSLILEYADNEQQKALKAAESVAIKAESRGELQYANDLRQAAISTKVEAKAVSITKTWKANVTDLRALLVAIIAGDAPADLVKVNETVLNGLARAYGAELGVRIPGVEAYQFSNVKDK